MSPADAPRPDREPLDATANPAPGPGAAPKPKRGGGPKTPEGKARSSRNSTRHGLTGAGKVLPDDFEHDYEEELAHLVERLKPADEDELRLLERAALANARLERCRVMEHAVAAKQVREAEHRWGQARAEEAAHWAGRLEKEPLLAKLKLESSAFGCLWLVEQWSELLGKLACGLGWDAPDARHALNLLGEARVPTLGSRAQLSQLGLGYLASWAQRVDRWDGEGRPTSLDLDPFRGFFGGEYLELDAHQRLEDWRPMLPTPDEARESLSALIEAEIVRLMTLRRTLLEEYEAEARAEAPMRALVDVSAEGSRLHRYETASWTALRQSLADLARLRRERASAPAESGATSSAPLWGAPAPSDRPAVAVGPGDPIAPRPTLAVAEIEVLDDPDDEDDDAVQNELGPDAPARPDEPGDEADRRARRDRERARRLRDRKRRRR